MYSDVEEEYAQFFTGEALNKIMNMRFKEINGYLYYSIAGATGWDAVKDVKVERVSETDNSITYKVKYSVPTENGAYNDECNMTIRLTNDGYRISLIDYREFMGSNDLKESNFSISNLYGKWYISSAVNGKTAEKETNVEKIVGKQYSSDELFLELNSDGTFNDTFEKLINNNLTNNGTYEFFESFNRAHDSRVVLTYVDGNDKLTTIMYFDPDLSTPYIGYGFINGYDVYLKRM